MLRTTKVAAAAVVGGVATVITGVAILGWAFGWHWGDVPTWVGALATFAALGAAVAGALGVFSQLRHLTEQVELQRDALRLQIQQADADRADRDLRVAQELEVQRIALRRQAEQIEITPIEQIQEPFPPFERGIYRTLHVENNSGRPIRNVTCRERLHGEERASFGTFRSVESDGGWIATDQTPGGRLDLLRRHATIYFGWGPSVDHVYGATYRIRFTDDAGLHWELTDDMHLRQISDRTDW